MILAKLSPQSRSRHILMVQTPEVAVAIVDELQRLLNLTAWTDKDKNGYGLIAMGLGCRNLSDPYPQFFELYWKQGRAIQKKHGDDTLCCNLFSNPTAILPLKIDRFIRTDDPVECKNLALTWIEHAINHCATPSYTKNTLTIKKLKSTDKGLDPYAALEILCAFSTQTLEQQWRNLYPIGMDLGTIKYSAPIPFDESQTNMTSAMYERKHLTANVNALVDMVNTSSVNIALPDLTIGLEF